TDLQFEMTTSETQTDGPGIFPLPDHVQIGPLRIGIGSARVTGSHIVIRHPQSVRTVEVGGADVTAWPVGGDLDVSGRIDMLRADAFGRREQVDQVVVDGRLSADLIRIRRLGWRWAGETIRLDGEVRRPWVATRELSLQVSGDVALAAIARAAGLDRPI